MNNTKSYFVNNETNEVYELSISKTKQLNKLYPKWTAFNCEDNYLDLSNVYEFFKQNGKLLAHPHFENVFIGLIE